MAKSDYIKLLEKGVDAWNRYWLKRPYTGLLRDLVEANLSGLNLDSIDLSYCDLSGANLSKTNLFNARLCSSKLFSSNLNNAGLSYTILDSVDLREAKLTNTDLCEMVLRNSDMSNADLSNAIAYGVVFKRLIVKDARFSNTSMGWSTFSDVDFSTAKDIETIRHDGPSSIGIESLYLLEGDFPSNFFHQAGIPNSIIKTMLSLSVDNFDYYSCFISYSQNDIKFAQKLYKDLQKEGVRCWFAPENIKIGEKIRQSIEQGIRSHQKLLLVLSEDSISSDWVEKEVETAFERERIHKNTVLFPIRLDSAVMDTNRAWAADIRRTRHIGNFVEWEISKKYKKAFIRLLRDLRQSIGFEKSSAKLSEDDDIPF